MSTPADDSPVQSPRAFRAFMHTLGYHVPKRLAEVEKAGRRIRALGNVRPPVKKGK
jgi:hypothetical protein